MGYMKQASGYGGVLPTPKFISMATASVGAPTITLTGSTAPTGLTLYTEGAPEFDYLGPGPWTVHADNVFRRPVAAAAYATVNWMTDEPDAYLRLINFNSKLQLWYEEYDGLGWKLGGQIATSVAGSREFARVVFSERKPRRFSLRGFNFGFGGVYVPTTGIVQRDVDVAALPLLIVTGDSYTQSTGAGGQSQTWAASFAQNIGHDLYAEGIGSMGYLSTSPNTPLERYNVKGAGALKRRNSGVETAANITLAGYAMGLNDTANASAISAMVSTIIEFCAVRPFFIGPWTPLGDTADLISKATAIESSAIAGGCKFVPTAGIVTSVNKSSLTGVDNQHPVQYGHDYIGMMLARRAIAIGIV